MSGPFQGVRVLDLTAVVSGPFATMILADQGADVIKVEPLQGDLMRTARTVIADGFSGLMISANRGKRSISIDIKSSAGKEVLSRLVGMGGRGCSEFSSRDTGTVGIRSR